MTDLDSANNLSDQIVLQKYQTAAEISNETLNQVILAAVPGKRVVELCILGDDIINQSVQKVYNQEAMNVKSKGVAFPTCISVNHCIGHFSPFSDDQSVLKQGDVVKIDLGVHIDGYISQCAHTIIVNPSTEEPTRGRTADVICAAYYAAECAHRLIRPGATNTQVSRAIGLVASTFNCSPVEGVLSHQIKCYIIDANKVIMNRPEPTQQAPETTFEAGEVYVVDIVISTGDGKAHESDNRTTVFKRSVDQLYNLRLSSSKAVATEINKKYKTLPFVTRALKDSKARLGIVELIKHDLLQPFPVLYEQQKQIVAQIKFTLLVLPDQSVRMNTFGAPYVSSEYSIDTCPEVANILNA